MDFNADHFALFNLSRVFRIDAVALDKRYREIQAQVHPDRFTSADEAKQRLSLQWATKVNEAYQTLRKPLSRGQYLLGLAGFSIDLADNHAMSADFLMEQMEWREAVAEARSGRDHAQLEQLYHRVRQRIKKGYDQLAQFLDDQHDYSQAGDNVRRLMFLEKLLSEIDEAMAAIET